MTSPSETIVSLAVSNWALSRGSLNRPASGSAELWSFCMDESMPAVAAQTIFCTLTNLESDFLAPESRTPLYPSSALSKGGFRSWQFSGGGYLLSLSFSFCSGSRAVNRPLAIVPSFSATAGPTLSHTSRSSSRTVDMSGSSVVSSGSLTSTQKFDSLSLSVYDSLLAESRSIRPPLAASVPVCISPPLAVPTLVLLFGTGLSLCPFSSDVSRSDKHPRIVQMFLRDSDTILLVPSVSHTSETNETEAEEMSLSLFSSAMMETEKMAGYSGTESSEKISPYLQSREHTKSRKKKKTCRETKKHYESVNLSVIQSLGP